MMQNSKEKSRHNAPKLTKKTNVVAVQDSNSCPGAVQESRTCPRIHVLPQKTLVLSVPNKILLSSLNSDGSTSYLYDIKTIW